MAFLRKYTNVDGDGQVAGQSPDSRGDFYDPTDKQRDFDYWQAKVGDVLRAISKTPSTEIQILQGGEITDAGSGNVDMAEGWAIVKNAAGDERIVNRPEFLVVVFPVAFNDGRDVWVASRFEQALDVTERSHKTESVNYKFIHIDSFTGDTAFGEATDDMFFDSDPGANYVIWDKITMTGTTFAKIVGRSPEWEPFNSIKAIADATDVDDSGVKVDDDLLVWDTDGYKRTSPATRIFAKMRAETDTGDTKSLLNVGTGDGRYIQSVGPDPGIVNGNLEHWQNNTLVIAAPSQTYVADLFKYSKVGPQVHTVSRTTEVPTEADGAVAGSIFSIAVDVTTVNTGLDATEFTDLCYTMEGLDFAPYFGKTFTVTFLVRSPLTGIYTLSFRNGPSVTRSFVAEYTINSANTWEVKTVTVTHDTTGAWNLDTNAGMLVTWGLAAGSSLQTTPGAWQNGNFIGTSAAVNLDVDTANIFRIAQISMNVGATARNNLKNTADELNRIGRLFQVYDNIRMGFHKTGNNQTIVNAVPFWVPMRVIPTIGFSSITPFGNIGSPSAVSTNKNQTSISLTSNTGSTENVNSTFTVEADSRF